MDNRDKNFVSAVIYVHNSENLIGEFLKNIMEVLKENFEYSEIICVNDASKDGSTDRIKVVGSTEKNISVSVINMSCFHGLEAAMNAGLDLAIGDFVFEFDTAVMDFDELEIMNIYRKALEGYDIVSACPDQSRGLFSKIFYRVFNRLASFSNEIHTESFRVLSRRGINRVKSTNHAVLYRKAVYAGCGLRTDCIVYKAHGLDSKNTHMDAVEKKYRKTLAVDAFLLFTDAGCRFSMAMTVFMMFTAAFMLIYSGITYAVSSPVEGWTTTILFLSVVFFGLFGILTVIVKYLQLLINLVFKRKRYSFESIEKLTKQEEPV